MGAPGIKADLEEKQTGTRSCRFLGQPEDDGPGLEEESGRAAPG